MDNVLAFLKECGVYFLATMDGDQARVRPFETICLYEDKLYIQTGKNKNVAKQIDKNPKVEISACKQNGQWIRITCELVLDDRIEPQEAMIEEYPSLKGMYKPGDPNDAVYYMKNATALFVSFAKVLGEVSF